jgi:hypothetical protein
MTETLVTSGARRGCGLRQPGGAYLAVPLSLWGQPLEAFLIDPPTVVARTALGLAPVGVSLIERDGVTHVLDIVGREHYPTVASFVDEARLLGVSRRISRRSEFARLSAESRLILLHPDADIANAPEFPSERRCPCEVSEHLVPGYADMCARLWWQEPLIGAQHRLGIFLSLPIAQIEVVRDPACGRHHDTIAAASRAELPVIEVPR